MHYFVYVRNVCGAQWRSEDNFTDGVHSLRMASHGVSLCVILAGLELDV